MHVEKDYQVGGSSKKSTNPLHSKTRKINFFDEKEKIFFKKTKITKQFHAYKCYVSTYNFELF